MPSAADAPDELHVEGVLADEQVRVAVDCGYINAGEFRVADKQVQPASLDLTLGEYAHRLRASFLPDRDPVDAKLKELSQGTIDLHRGGFLEHNVPYLVELRERLALPDWLRAKANPKSSTGRLDVFTRVICDNSYHFDEIPRGYQGALYVEIVPISFPIRVREGLSLNQLRLMAGATPRMTDEEIRALHDETPLLYRDGKPVDELALSNGLLVSVDLSGDADGIVGYKARSHTRLLDMTGAPSDPVDFWEPIRAERGQRIVLEPEAFYLLLSREGISIPPRFAAEMVAYDPTSGELRTHYAGFFDPGFGFGPHSPDGSRAALEVRAHDVPFVVEHGQAVCKLGFERMSATPKRLYGADVASHYQNQSTTLSKYFRGDVTGG
ncbi:MAG: 2'-deoxycytidine 5'-triphosphate deaminase [Actinomycetes bacterium]